MSDTTANDQMPPQEQGAASVQPAATAVPIPKLAVRELPEAPERITHTGQGSQLFAITLRNLLLKLVTFGVYHFWGKARVRRYVWSHTQLAGEAFEFTGTGKEMFLGYLVAMCFVVPLIGALYAIQIFFADNIFALLGGTYALYIVIGLLGAYAAYSARRYMYSRTRWRGIRFGLGGSAWKYAWLTLGYGLLAAFSGGLFTPFMRILMQKRVTENTWFGDRKLDFTGDPTGTFLRYLAVYAIMIVFFVVFIGVIVGLVVVSQMSGEGEDPSGLMEYLPLLMVGIYLVFLPVMMTAWWWFQAGEFKFFAKHTHMGETRIRLDYKSWQYIWLQFSNLVLVLFTLGLGLPWVITRSMRFITSHMRFEGDLNLAGIGQHPEAEARGGEGFAEALDLGGI